MSTALVCSLVALALIIAPASAQYQLSIGDTVHVSVYGQKELERRAIVDGNGKIWVPSVGHVQAAGRTLKELHDSLSAVLTTNESIRVRDINVDVVGFHPFYIYGKVTNPGAYPYQIGLTVRHAIALAGGFERSPPEQRDKLEGLWSQYMHQHARADRLKAELEGRDRVGWTPPPNSRILPEVARRIGALEEKQFEARVASVERKTRDLDQAINLIQTEIDQLELQARNEEAQAKVMSDTLSMLESLKERRIVPLARVYSYESTYYGYRFRQESTKVQLVRARQKKHEKVSDREQMKLSRHAKLTGELQGAAMEMDRLRSQMFAAANLPNSNAVIERLCVARGKGGIIIHRKKKGQSIRRPARQHSEVRPGDVIEVNIVDESLQALCLSQRR